MNRATQWLSMTAMAVLTLGAAVSCRDDKPTSTPAIQLSVPSRSQEELLQRVGYVGELHNEVTNALLREWRKPHKSRRAACVAAVALVRQENIPGLTLTPEIRAQMTNVLTQLRLCGGSKQSVLRQANWLTALPETTWYYPSSTASAMMDDITNEGLNASSVSGLSSALSSYYSAAAQMSWPDDEAVAGHADLVLGSFDNWDSPTLDVEVDEYAAWMNTCSTGQLEGEYLYMEEATYQCAENEWRMVRNPGERRPTVRLVSAVQSDPCSWSKDEIRSKVFGSDALAGVWAWNLSKIFGIIYPGAGQVAQPFIAGTAAAASSAYQYTLVSWQRRNC